MFWNKKPKPVAEINKIEHKPPVAILRMGITEDNRVSFSIGNNVFNQLFLNKDGCVDLCSQLMAFANALDEEVQNEPKPTSPV